MHRRTHALSLAAAGFMSLAACASPEPASTPAPLQDGAAEGAPDVFAEVRPDVGEDAEADTPVADAPDALPESDALEEPDVCIPQVPADAADGACTPGTAERQWCGACGRRQRYCGYDGQWKPWSDCFEDELAVCGQCEAREVSCGACGKRVVACETSQDTCRWILGACTQSGGCVAGDYEVEPGGCGQGQVKVRWCSASCAWDDAGPCGQSPGWGALPQAPIEAREGAASVVTGSKWFLWGGIGAAGYLDDGATFEPTTGVWQAVAPAPMVLSARTEVAITWTGADVILFGGVGTGDAVFGDGARWSESSGWAGLSANGAPSPRRGATAIWAPDAGVVVFWGGRGAYGGAASGGARYHPSSDSWEGVSASPIGNRQGHVAVWDSTHDRMIVWGGAADSTDPPERSGAAYDPLTDAWTAIPDAPIRRKNAFAFWDSASGKVFVVMGEDGAWSGPRGDGAVYDPASGSWELLPELAMTGYSPGWRHVAAWGAGQAWVTGGDVAWAGGFTGFGARYLSVSDSWGRLPAFDEPRAGHATAYLGSLLVWGGRGASGLLSSGARLSGAGFGP